MVTGISPEIFVFLSKLMHQMKNILVIGSNGQIGTELVNELRRRFGADHVVASDIKAPAGVSGKFEVLDVLDRDLLKSVITRHQITEVYLLAALLSGTAEKNPAFAWELNMEGLFNVLNLAKDGIIKKIFWPSSIAVFGPNTPRVNTPQYAVMDPNTVYGISKQAGERWCEYYHEKYGVDVRSIRYPGLISWTAMPGGGTTDYAVEIFHEALKHKKYTSFLKADTALPMMYMEDAINATIAIMEAPSENIKNRSSYNLAGISFTPETLSKAIQKHIPEFTIDYVIDFRQAIANSWPQSIDDTAAQEDWGWQHAYDLEKMVKIMLENLRLKYDKLLS